MRALGEAAVHLPWLSPCAASLTALARAPTDAWEVLRADPGAVLLIVRQTAAALVTPAVSFYPALLQDVAVVEGALHFLEAADPRNGTPRGFIDWTLPSQLPILQAGLRCARTAHRLAEQTARCDADNAWVAALLAPLGWYAVCAIDPERVTSCLSDPAHARHPSETEQRHWGIDAASILRRLAQIWRLPCWLRDVLSCLGLPVEAAARLGADPDLFRIVQLAVGLVQQQGQSVLHLPVRPASAEAAAALGLSTEAAEALTRAVHEEPVPSHTSATWAPPDAVPLLREFLTLAAENRRLRSIPTVEHLQRIVDQLHHTLEEQIATEARRLQTQKLSALAEFAAGAGHEINNPLAVISGQAQYLLKKRAECGVRSAECPEESALYTLHSAMEPALQTIIQQTRRVNQILTELMHFARPRRPQRETVDAAGLVCEVAAALAESATERQVELRMLNGSEQSAIGNLQSAILLHADPQQVRTALTCLLRNAIESAPAGGWARVRVDTSDPEFVELVVEDSGGGPASPQREHLFDPFYSGRHAGRGRGLGLPTAWRLAREHGGDVRFESRAGAPTRFVLSLPRGTNGHAEHNGANGATG